MLPALASLAAFLAARDSLLILFLCSLLDVSSCQFSKIYQRFANSSVGVIEIIEEFAKFFGVETDGLNADLVEARNDGFDAVVEFINSLVIDVAVDACDARTFRFTKSLEKVFGLLDGGFEVGRRIIWDDDKEGLVHNVGFLSEDVDEVDIIIH